MEWPVKQLTDVVESFHQGLNTAGEKIKFVDSGFPIIQTRNLSDGKIDLDKKIKYLSQVDWDKYREKYRPEIGDVFFTNIGTIGKTAVVNESLDYLIHWNIFKIRPFEVDVSPNYLKCYLDFLTSTGYFCDSQKGGTVSFVTKKMMGAVEIPLPPIPEQQRIVAILDQAFADIEKARANAEKNLKNARELFDNYLFGIFGRPHESWVETTVGDLCVKMEYGSSAKSQNEGEIPVLRMGNLQKGEIDWTDLKYSADPEEIKKYMLQKGDVLFNRTNSDEHVGKTAIYRGEMPAIFAGYLIRVHRKQELLDGDFLNFYLNSSIARDYGKTVMSRSVNQANINASKLKEYPIIVPDMKTQNQLVSIFSSLKDELERLEKVYVRKLSLLDTLKKSLLQKAFSGELTKSKGIAA